MKLVVQRVTEASVTVEEKLVGKIGKGYLVLLGVGENDTEATAKQLADKLVKLRIFSDENDKTNLSINDVGGEVLVISQFTLYADCKKNRPSFCHAGKPDLAEHLYEYFMECLRPQVKNVEHGIFGAMMQVSLCNDGPFTVILEG
ncbi:MAG: D-tyrosyl-tRNA(Tyr) deacylase [Oscillospiraceae bacterium]|nr:D-tyrosyl-tRNA(Tyr) deacylase [Oscillospiraceae bacterium]MBQ9110232.1 D-tyrosyl-tRNA(Tyr) deacylase [Oscillospiraceae bacterium]